MTREPCDRLHHWICEKVIDMDQLEDELKIEGPYTLVVFMSGERFPLSVLCAVDTVNIYSL